MPTRKYGKRARRNPQANKENAKTKALAAAIFENQQESEITSLDEASVGEFTRPYKAPTLGIFDETSHPVDIETGEPKRVILPSGTSPLNLFIVKEHENEIFTMLGGAFGRDDGSFFVHGDNTFTRQINGQNKRLKILLIEDKNHFKYQVWMDITALSLLGGLTYFQSK